MTSARIACLLRFFLWFFFAWVIKIKEITFSQNEFISILALFEILIATAPFLDEKEPKTEK